MNPLARDILAGVFTILVGLIVFYGIKYVFKINRITGDTLGNKYLKFLSKYSNREYKEFHSEETSADRVTKWLIQAVGLLFVIFGMLYLLSILFREIT